MFNLMSKTSASPTVFPCHIKNRCTGCGACFSICPTRAITMKQNQEGFLYPAVNNGKCISCGKCKKKCPENDPVPTGYSKPQGYAVWANDNIRMNSSSGGIFSVLALDVLNRGGVVCGAAYDKNLVVKHIIVEDMEGLSRLNGSKYVESDTIGIYPAVKNHLKAGCEVLFSGCPCQVAGLRSYLGKKYANNLLCVDLLCHGVPSPLAFQKYLEEEAEKGHGKVTKVRFRKKEEWGWCANISIMFEDGTVIDKFKAQDIYLQAYLKFNIFLRLSCATCSYAKQSRVGDITIGDFWKIGIKYPELDDTLGTSLVLCNNSTGEKRLSAIASQLKKIQKISSYVESNTTLSHPSIISPHRSRFFKLLHKLPFSKAVYYSSNNYYDVGIVNFWQRKSNYGSFLTAFCLYHLLKERGLQVALVHPANFSPEDHALKNAFSETEFEVICLKNNETLNRHIGFFIVGSDQIWNDGIITPGTELSRFFFLDFVNDTKKKIAFAASFGDAEYLPSSSLELVKSLLQRFDFISVREDDGVKICKQRFGFEATWVLDPVFLYDLSRFNILDESPSIRPSKSYIAAYFLRPNTKLLKDVDFAEKYLKMKALPLFSCRITSASRKKLNYKHAKTPSWKQWLSSIKNCDFLITDSYHAVCLAILFKKPFICYSSRNYGYKRFASLLKLFNLEKRMLWLTDKLSNHAFLVKDQIDYDTVHHIIATEQKKSLNWLNNALVAPEKPYIYDSYRDGLDIPQYKRLRYKFENIKKHPVLLPIRRILRVMLNILNI